MPRVPPMGHEGMPFRPEADEQAMWSRAEKEEAKLLETGTPYDDPLLRGYLSEVADRLVPAEVKAAGAPPIRIHVIRDPRLNAFAMPNGALFVHTGLLARMENEAQLAAVLGHEIVHVTHRHALQLQREMRHGPFLALDPPLVHVAAVSGFGRRLEHEADAEGLARMAAVGYDPREGPRVFERLAQDRSDRGALETFFFGNPARLEERVGSTQAVVRARHASLRTDGRGGDSADLAVRFRVLVRENAALDVRAGRFGLAQAQLDRVLSLAPDDPVAHLYQGDLYRLRAQWGRGVGDATSLLAEARAGYERAARLDPSSPEPYRRLGLLFYQSKERDKAVEAFRRYLALSRDPAESRRVKEYLLELER